MMRLDTDNEAIDDALKHIHSWTQVRLRGIVYVRV